MIIKHIKIKWVWRFLLAILISSILMAMIWIFSMFREPPQRSLVFDSLLIFMAYICLETVSFFQLKLFKISGFKSQILNNAFSLIGSIISGTIVYVTLFYFYKWLDYYISYSEPPMIQHIVATITVGLVMSIIFALIQFAVIWRHQYYNSYIENEQFKKEIADANLSILKHQLDPHFMFNNFNTLYYLIDENNQLAQKFLKNISTIYRYILKNSDTSLIDSVEEYEITKQYLEVLKQRFSESLKIDDQIELKDLEDKQVPPLVLQQLIENAIKHNRIDNTSPLSIGMTFEDNYFTITNNLNPRQTEKTQKTGLKNIEKRYKFLTNDSVIIDKTDQAFSVSIPLIQTIDEN